MEISDPYKNKYKYYINLLSLSYQDAVQFLLERHGDVVDNYYKEKAILITYGNCVIYYFTVL